MVLVSVIVPIYNSEKYLEKCLDSLVNQNFKDYEVIVVNDESPDNSEKIIQEYEKKYSFLHSYVSPHVLFCVFSACSQKIRYPMRTSFYYCLRRRLHNMTVSLKHLCRLQRRL